MEIEKQCHFEAFTRSHLKGPVMASALSSCCMLCVPSHNSLPSRSFLSSGYSRLPVRRLSILSARGRSTTSQPTLPPSLPLLYILISYFSISLSIPQSLFSLISHLYLSFISNLSLALSLSSYFLLSLSLSLLSLSLSLSLSLISHRLCLISLSFFFFVTGPYVRNERMRRTIREIVQNWANIFYLALLASRRRATCTVDLPI